MSYSFTQFSTLAKIYTITAREPSIYSSLQYFVLPQNFARSLLQDEIACAEEGLLIKLTRTRKRVFNLLLFLTNLFFRSLLYSIISFVAGFKTDNNRRGSAGSCQHCHNSSFGLGPERGRN